MTKTKTQAKKEQSPLQKVCMKYGQSCFAFSNTHSLHLWFKVRGMDKESRILDELLVRARLIAREEYFKERKELQPDWKDWDAQLEERIAKWED